MGDAFRALLGNRAGNWFRPASHSTRAAKAVSRFVSRVVVPKFDPSIIIFSGDLAATGVLADLNVAADYLSQSQSTAWADENQAPHFFSAGKPITVMPGNHDRYQGSSLLPGGKNFEVAFPMLWDIGSSCGRISKPVVLHRDGERLGLISADFTFRTLSESQPSLYGFVGKGKVHADVLANLEAATTHLHGQGEVAVVWILHYPPGFPNGDPDLALEDEHLLLSAAARHGIKLILGGHTHVAKQYAAQQAHVSCVGSAMQASPDSAWHFAAYELLVDHGVLKEVITYPFEYETVGRNNFVEKASTNCVIT